MGYSPLSRLEEVEGLLLAVTAQRTLWRSLDGLDLAGHGIDTSVRVREADAQLDRLNGLLDQAAILALVPVVA